MGKHLSGLFINCVKAQDSIFESGKMAYDCLISSDKYSLDYIEISRESAKIPTNYDFYLFNYHLVTMAWLDTSTIKQLLPGVKLTLVLEVSPNDPFALCSPKDFDGYCVLDPTLTLSKKNVFAFPRPLEKTDKPVPYKPKDIPVIGSFGFATPGKGFEHVIDAVNKEFEKAVVKINIPYATYADTAGEYAKELSDTCKNKAKEGIEVIITHDFMSKFELIEWCGQNTLNCFLYDRNQPGLAATTDQAITSGRPLITSKNNTFRHIQKYIKPFPYQSLKEAIETTAPIVEQIQIDWSPEKFREKFENVLAEFQFDAPVKSGEDDVQLSLLPIPSIPEPVGFFQNLRDHAAIKTRIDNYKKGYGFKRRVELPPEPIISYSQFGEDVFINDLFNDIPLKSLSYLDIGANNPEFISNTYLFYKRDFKGVLVEPNPYLCGKLKYVRPRDTVLNYGIGIDKSVKEADFYLFSDEADGLSTFSAEEAQLWEEVGLNGATYKVERIWKIPLLDINDVIEKYFTECPDFISIDVEGWDLKILKTFDFEKHSPAVFCIETLAYKNDGSVYKVEEINEVLEENGYIAFKETYANTLFVNKKLYDFYLYQKSQRPVIITES
jgi:FkbM family methyltransferase